MLIALLAAAALADPAAQQPPPPAGSDVVVHANRAETPTRINVASSDENSIDVSVWPMNAYQARVNGEVKLRCWVDRYGLAESCEVISETPARLGFGAAAVELRTTFKLTPAKAANGDAIASSMVLDIHFRAPLSQIGVGEVGGGGIPSAEGSSGNLATGIQVQNALALKPVTMLDNPIWAVAPSFDDVARAYPAQANGAGGYAVAHCRVHQDGTLDDCQLIKETPEALGFGKAALTLATKFRVAPGWTRPPGAGELWVDVPIRFEGAGASSVRVVSAPRWLAGVDPATAPKVYPPEAAAKGVTSGLGVARCNVAADGSLTDCAPEPGDPDGLGFSDAAVRLAAVMRMNPWSQDAAPVAGGVVYVRVRLNLDAGG